MYLYIRVCVCIGPKRDKQDAADSAGQARGTEREKGTAASRERERES